MSGIIDLVVHENENKKEKETRDERNERDERDEKRNERNERDEQSEITGVTKDDETEPVTSYQIRRQPVTLRFDF